MKVVHVSRFDMAGGAARAAHRVHSSLRRAGVDSWMRVRFRISNDERVVSGPAEGVGAIENGVRSRLSELPLRLFRRRHAGTQSVAWPDTGLGAELNSSDVDIINLHWLGNDTLSIEEIGRLTKPVVWRLADMWAFCGAEHYADDGPESRFRTGYIRNNCVDNAHWFDLDRWVWQRKRKHWSRSIHIVCTSQWLASCARGSEIFRDNPVSVIPNALDMDVWRPLDKGFARDALGLDRSANIVLFGAPSGLNDPRKGGQLALDALGHLAVGNSGPDQLVVFGQKEGAKQTYFPIPTRFLGRLEKDSDLVLAYSAADLFIMPSRQESFGQTASEALACGTPVAAFDTGGLPDIVTHRETGWLAKPFKSEDLAVGIAWMLADKRRLLAMQHKAREMAEKRFAEAVVAAKYIALYESILGGHETVGNS